MSELGRRQDAVSEHQDVADEGLDKPRNSYKRRESTPDEGAEQKARLLGEKAHDSYTVTIDGTVIAGNSAREGGGAVFFVSNDRTGTLRIEHSRLRGNPNAGFQTAGYPGVFFLGRGTPLVIASTLS